MASVERRTVTAAAPPATAAARKRAVDANGERVRGEAGVEEKPLEFGCARCPYRSRNLGEWAAHVEECREERSR